MIYKFHKDQHGEVAEARDEDLESWLNLHYPGSDIPAQARELYKLDLHGSLQMLDVIIQDFW